MKSRWRLFTILAILMVGVWLAYWLAAVHISGFDGWAERGQFGDMFGALNALFSGLALAGVVFALLLQMEELKLQREEMQNSREELAKSANAQIEQVKLLAQQVAAMESSVLSARELRRREIQPVFAYINAPSTGTSMEIQLKNEGGLARDLNVRAQGNFSARPIPADAVATGGTLEIRIQFNGAPPRPMEFEIDCRDLDDNSRTFKVVTDPWVRQFRCREVPAVIN